MHLQGSSRYRGFSKAAWFCLLLSSVGCGTHSTAPVAAPAAGGTTGTANSAPAGPVMGYVWDTAAGGLRTIVGLPGASYLGSATFNDGSYSGAVVCRKGTFALLTGTQGQVYFVDLPAGQPIQATAKLSAKQHIAISPSCNSALVYSSDSKEAFLLQGFSGSPTSKTITTPEHLIMAAVADSGAVLTASTLADGTVSVDAIRADGSAAAKLASLSKFGGFTFIASTENALIADTATNTLWLQAGLATSSISQVAGVADGVESPTSVGSSADARWAVVMNDAGSILRIDLSKQVRPEKITCSCSPTNLVPLSGNLIFRMTDAGAGPVWAFDGDLATARVVFVPGSKAAVAAGAVR